MKKYLQLYKWTYALPLRAKVFRAIDSISVVATILAYLGYILWGFLGDPEYALRIVWFTALPFLAFSLFRRGVSFPRPYEMIDFEVFGLPIPSKKKGMSFPSRHVFSAFLIGTVMLGDLTLLGIIVMLLGSVIAVCRVLLGVHFIKDVVVGAIVGVIGGLIGIFLM